MRAMQKELGNEEMKLLEGYDMVDQWGFAGDVNANEESEGGCRNDDGWVDGPGYHRTWGAENIPKMDLS
jgi:hypothetical protein